MKESMEEERAWMDSLRQHQRTTGIPSREADRSASNRSFHSWEGNLWSALAFCSGWSSYIAAEAGEDSESADTTQSSTYFSLCLYLGIAAFATFLVLYSWNRKTYWKPVSLNNAKMNPFPSLSSAHLSAMLTGPFEALQLSAVTCYFLWPTADDPSSSHWASRMLFWGSYSTSANFHTSLILYLLTGLVWIVKNSDTAVMVATVNNNDDSCQDGCEGCEEDCCEDCCEDTCFEDCCSCGGCCENSSKSSYEYYNTTLSLSMKAHRFRSSPLYNLIGHLINRLSTCFLSRLLRPLSYMVVDVQSGEEHIPASVVTTSLPYANGALRTSQTCRHGSDIVMCGPATPPLQHI